MATIKISSTTIKKSANVKIKQIEDNRRGERNIDSNNFIKNFNSMSKLKKLLKYRTKYCTPALVEKHIGKSYKSSGQGIGSYLRRIENEKLAFYKDIIGLCDFSNYLYLTIEEVNRLDIELTKKEGI